MRRSYAYEVPAFYLGFLLLERTLFPGRPGFFQVEPHPYWAGVLLFSLRYGLGAGLWAGAAAAGLYLWRLWTGGDRFLFEDAEFYVLPGLFMGVGAVAGGAVDRLLRRGSGLEARLEAERARSAALAREVELQQAAGRVMEQQVVSQMSSLVTLYHGSRELGSLDREAIYSGILDFFSQALSAAKSALYVRQEDRWVLRSSRGWEASDPYPKALGMTEGVVGRAGSEKRVVSLRDWFGDDVRKAWEGRAQADAVMAGPLRDAQGEAVAVFSVQDLPLLRFNSSSLNLLTLLLDWAEEALAKCQYFEELKSKVILDEVFGVYNHDYFRARCEQEFARSKIHGLPLSLLLVSSKGLSALAPGRQVNFLRALSRLLREKCRKIDIVTKYDRGEVPFAVMMVASPAEQARRMREELLEAFDKLALGDAAGDGAVRLRIGVGSYDPSMEGKEALIGQAEAELS